MADCIIGILVTDTQYLNLTLKGAMTVQENIDLLGSFSLKNWGPLPIHEEPQKLKKNVYIESGWGRLIFAHTFDDNKKIEQLLRSEEAGKRDIAFYAREPHVTLSKDPHALFLDPSHTYRFNLRDNPIEFMKPKSFQIRKLNPKTDLDAVNRIYRAQHMVAINKKFLKNNEDQDVITYFVAIDEESNDIISAVMGVDHVKVFDDPENGSSLWCLAVDPQARIPGIGQAMVLNLLQFYKNQGRLFLDLSVMHNNTEAIQLYEKLNFIRVPVFCLKRKNAINEKLYIGPEPEADLNPYSKIIIDEARLRGISIKVIDTVNNYFSLSYGGRTIVCRESLTDLTSAVAMSQCADKSVTHLLLDSIGIRVPHQHVVHNNETDFSFLQKYKNLAVKPADGEQGKGISLMISSPDELELAICKALKVSDKVILEEFITGKDLRIVVIDYQVVAAAIRKPAEVVGDGESTIQALIIKQSRRREAATQGESSIPLDKETERCVNAAGFHLSDVLPVSKKLTVRRTANLHTGGTIHDVTDKLHPALEDAAVLAAKTLNIPVVGIDFIVKSSTKPEYVFIEANERPGLANHEPQPTAQRFIDLLFPNTADHMENHERS